MRRCRRERGFSLIELQVAFVAAAILGLAIFSLFRLGLALWQRGAEVVDAGEAAVAMDVIAREIWESSSHPDAVWFWPNPGGHEGSDAVALRAASGPVGASTSVADGVPAWNDWVAFVYDPDRSELHRVHLASLADLPSPPRDRGGIVARQVRSFTVQREGDRIFVLMSIEKRGRILTLQTAIRPRNW